MLIVLASCREPEPVYGGRCLSEWLMVYAGAVERGPGLPTKADAVDAVRHIGPAKAVPLMVKWICYETPLWRQRIEGPMSKLPKPLKHATMDRHTLRADVAYQGFRIFGAEAAAAIPELARLVGDAALTGKASKYRATYALAAIGGKSLPALIVLVTNGAPSECWCAVDAIRDIQESDVDVSAAVPAMLSCLQEKETIAAGLARQVMAKLQSRPLSLVPELTNCLQSSDPKLQEAAIEYLGSMGENARCTIPELIPFLRAPDTRLRGAATNAIEAIAPDVLNRPP